MNRSALTRRNAFCPSFPKTKVEAIHCPQERCVSKRIRLSCNFGKNRCETILPNRTGPLDVTSKSRQPIQTPILEKLPVHDEGETNLPIANPKRISDSNTLIAQLPAEMWTLIFEAACLNHTTLRRTRQSIMLTCTLWREIVLSSPSL